MRTAEQNCLVGTCGRLQTDLGVPIPCLNERLAALDNDIETLLRASPWWRANDALWQSAPGIGPMCPDVVAGTPRVRDARKRQQIAVWGGRAHVRTVLDMGLLVATRDNTRIKAFDERLLDAGKVKKVALTACMHRFLTMFNAMLKPRTPWQAQAVQG